MVARPDRCIQTLVSPGLLPEPASAIQSAAAVLGQISVGGRTHAFPMELKKFPVSQLTEYGAYAKDKIYTQQDIKEIVEYANKRGINIQYFDIIIQDTEFI